MQVLMLLKIKRKVVGYRLEMILMEKLMEIDQVGQ